MSDAVASVCVFSLVCAALGSAAITASRATGADPVAAALARAAASELPVAAGIEKYRGARLLPRVCATTVPMPAGSPLPATISLNVSPLPGGRIGIEITAAATGSTQRESASATLPAPAPLPGSQTFAPQPAGQPTGAP